MSLRNLSTIRSIRAFSCSKLYKVEPSNSKIFSDRFKFKHFSSSPAFAGENKTIIGGINLSWEKFGNGPHVALCLPGLVGSAALHFHPVVKKMNLEKFTVIAWDPPGYGKSRPPDRDVLTQQSFRTDARLAGALMKELGYDKYSLIGYSNGGVTGALLAAAEPEIIKKLFMCSSAFMSCERYTQKSNIMNAMADLENWEPTLLKETLGTYEEPYLLKMLWEFKEWVIQQCKSNTFNEYCSNEMKKIRAPTLYIRSTNDVVVPPEDAKEYGKLIQNFKSYQVNKGSHNHLEYVDEFVAACENFLLSEEND